MFDLRCPIVRQQNDGLYGEDVMPLPLPKEIIGACNADVAINTNTNLNARTTVVNANTATGAINNISQPLPPTHYI